MCGAIGEPDPTWPKVGDMRLTDDTGIERWTGSEWVDARPVIDWDRIERFVVTTRVDGGHQTQSVYKEAVTAVLTDGYSTERYVRPDIFEEYPPGDVPQQWSRDYLKRFIQDTIREYGLVPNNYDQVERGPVTGVSEKAGDATDGPEDWTGASRPEWSHRNATDGESRPPTPESKWSPDRLVQEIVSWYSVVRGVTLSEDYRRDLEIHLSRIQEGG